MKYAMLIVSAIFPKALSSALSRYDGSPVKGEPPVNARIIKRTRTNYRSATIPQRVMDGVGNHLLPRFPRGIFREIETATVIAPV